MQLDEPWFHFLSGRNVLKLITIAKSFKIFVHFHTNEDLGKSKYILLISLLVTQEFKSMLIQYKVPSYSSKYFLWSLNGEINGFYTLRIHQKVSQKELKENRNSFPYEVFYIRFIMNQLKDINNPGSTSDPYKKRIWLSLPKRHTQRVSSTEQKSICFATEAYISASW